MIERPPYNHSDFRLDFIGIGAAKAGTTWLADNLRKHPEIFIPEQKELVYFNKYLRLLPGTENPDHGNSLSWYHAFFEPAKSERLMGEISVEYLIDKQAAQKIFQYQPNVKIILMLRKHPDQLFSLYQYMSARGVFNYGSFEEAIKDRRDLFENYFFAKHLQRYLDLFKSEQVGIFFFDDILSQPEKLYSDVCAFLGVDHFVPDGLRTKSNVTKEARLPFLNHVIQKGRHFITENKLEFLLPLLTYTGILPLGKYIRDKANVRPSYTKPKMSPETREYLRDFYADDVRVIEKITGRDLSSWKGE